MQGRLDFSVNDNWVGCSEPFIHLILSPKDMCIWMLKVWPVNDEDGCEHLCFRSRHTFKIVNL